jgi:[acyl-carrier-protein] S-malonyltransferase
MSSLTGTFYPLIAECLSCQGAQTVGMGAEAQSVPAAAKLFNQANDILGYLRNSQ